METLVQKHLENWLEGDEPSFQYVFHHYYQRLLSFAFRFLKDRALAEEVTMDTLLKAWQKKDEITDTSTFQSWLFVILRNRMVSLLRKKQPALVPISEREEELSTEEADSGWITREMIQRYQDCINRMPPKQKRVFLMSREEGLSHAEIASQLGVSVFTVKNQIKASLQFLRTELAQTGLLPVIYGTILLDTIHPL